MGNEKIQKWDETKGTTKSILIFAYWKESWCKCQRIN